MAERLFTSIQKTVVSELDPNETGKRGDNLRCSITDLSGRVGTGLVVHLVVVLKQLLLVDVLTTALVLHERGSLREERVVVVARAEVLRKAGERSKVESATTTTAVVLLLLLLSSVVISVALVVVVAAIALVVVAAISFVIVAVALVALVAVALVVVIVVCLFVVATALAVQEALAMLPSLLRSNPDIVNDAEIQKCV